MNISVKKGIILAGGSGSRLYPATRTQSKQLLPIYDKPMIYYPLATLMQAGIREILIISTPEDTPRLEQLFGNGHQLGLDLSYAVQKKPEGIAQAYLIAEDFLQNDNSALILGDNIFYGESDYLDRIENFEKGALIFGYPVTDPQRYGVIQFDDNDKPVDIEEKPAHPGSRYAMTGLYIADSRAVEFASKLTPSARGELEITEIMQMYLDQGELEAMRLGRGLAWLDTGTHESMLAAANFIAAIEKRQGLKIACIEEIALRLGYIDKRGFTSLIDTDNSSSYSRYLKSILEEF